MKKDALWQAYLDRNPQWKDEKANAGITVKGLRKLFDQTYDKGFEQGKAVVSQLDKAFGSIFKK